MLFPQSILVNCISPLNEKSYQKNSMQDSDTKPARLESYFDSQPSNLHISWDTSEDSYSSSDSSTSVETEYSNTYRAEVPSNGIDNDIIKRGIVDRDVELFYMM